MVRQNTILIVDDDRGFREICGTFLELDGFSVAEASNGADALIWCLNQRPDIVLLDLEMPVLDGWGFLQYRQREASLRGTPVVAMTSERETAGVYESLGRFGVDELLHKPVHREELVRAVRALIERPIIPIVRSQERAAPHTKRTDPRVVFAMSIRVRTRSFGSTWGRLRDLSAGGLGADLRRRLSSGERVTLTLPMGGGSISLTGVVQWTTEDFTARGYGHGIRFNERQEDSFPLHVYSFFRKRMEVTH